MLRPSKQFCQILHRKKWSESWQKSSKKMQRGRGSNPGKPAAQQAQERIKKKRERRIIPHGVVYVAASFNNTQISITDTDGRVVCWSSAGAIASRIAQGHAYAAQQASWLPRAWRATSTG